MESKKRKAGLRKSFNTTIETELLQKFRYLGFRDNRMLSDMLEEAMRYMLDKYDCQGMK